MASTLLNEQGFDPDWIERQLAHKEKDTSRIAYNHAQYLPQRHHMMQAWADFWTACAKMHRRTLKCCDVCYGQQWTNTSNTTQ